MDKYQFAIYLLALLSLVGTFRTKKVQTAEIEDNIIKQHCGILKYTLIVTVLGGAMFYMIWEGSGRYILPYFIMTIPYAAAGLGQLEKLICSSLKKGKTSV